MAAGVQKAEIGVQGNISLSFPGVLFLDQAVQFLSKAPMSEKLLVRVRFADGEVIEGGVNNAVGLLIETGFYLWPSDPEDNNISIFAPPPLAFVP